MRVLVSHWWWFFHLMAFRWHLQGCWLWSRSHLFFFRFGSALSLLVSLPFSSFFVFVFPLLLLQSISFPSVDPFFGNVTSWVLIVSNPGWKNGTSSRPYPSCFALGVLCCSCTSRSTRSSSEASSVVTFIALHLPRVFL